MRESEERVQKSRWFSILLANSVGKEFENDLCECSCVFLSVCVFVCLFVCLYVASVTTFTTTTTAATTITTIKTTI